MYLHEELTDREFAALLFFFYCFLFSLFCLFEFIYDLMYHQKLYHRSKKDRRDPCK